jgi:hypothetical protein
MVVSVLHTPFMHVVHMPLMHCSIFEYWPICGGPPVVLHTPLIHVVQKLLMHDVEVDVEDDDEVDDGTGTDDLRLGGNTPQFGLLFAKEGFAQNLCQGF